MPQKADALEALDRALFTLQAGRGELSRAELMEVAAALGQLVAHVGALINDQSRRGSPGGSSSRNTRT